MFDEAPSSPPNASSTAEYAIAYYKAQYETLESELAEFQASSQELEAELEKDVEAAEARERQLQARAEELNDKVVEWQNKYRQQKTEAAEVERRLQQEITQLRRENRELGHRLRDIEVQNDDFEKKERNMEGTVADLEGKWNRAIERNVMMEEEIRIGDQEREQLRIETQRLKGDLSDLRIEADVLRDKLTRAEARGAGQIQLPPLLTSNNSFTAPSSPQPFLDESCQIDLSNSSPFVHTPRTTTDSSQGGTPTPPSPPISDRSSATANSSTNQQQGVVTISQTTTPKPFRTPLPPRGSRIRAPSADLSVTPKPSRHGHSKLNDTSMGTPPLRPSRATTPSVSRVRKEEMRNKYEKALPAAPQIQAEKRGLPNSNSLIHMRAITAQMKRLELRVQSAKSKLPEPKSALLGTATPPPSGLGMPDSITVRSRKRTVGSASVNSSVLSGSTGDDAAPSLPSGKTHVPRVSTSGISRLSFGTASTRPTSQQTGEFARPPSRSSVATSNSNYNTSTSIGASSYSQSHNGGFAIPDRPASRMTADRERPASSISDRPQSRGSTTHSHSTSTYERPASRSSTTSGVSGVRPQSRSSMGRQTPLGQLAESRRPRSSIGQAAATRPDFSKTVGPGSAPGYGSIKGHKAGSQSVSISRLNYDLTAGDEVDREARSRENLYNSSASTSRAPTPNSQAGVRRSVPNFGGDGAGSEYASDASSARGAGGFTNFSQSVSGLPDRSAIPLPRRASAQLGQTGLGRSPSSSIPAISGIRGGGLTRSPSGLTRSPSTSISSLRGPTGLTRSPGTSISGLKTSTTPGITRPGINRGPSASDRLGRLHEGREPLGHNHRMHDGELLGGKGERVTVSGQGIVGRRKGEVLREQQLQELERKRLERQARAKGLGLERGGVRSGNNSRPGSSSNSAAGSAQSSPRKGEDAGMGRMGMGRMGSVSLRRDVDLGETW